MYKLTVDQHTNLAKKIDFSWSVFFITLIIVLKIVDITRLGEID